jgi:hypothetical protein
MIKIIKITVILMFGVFNEETKIVQIAWSLSLSK